MAGDGRRSPVSQPSVDDILDVLGRASVGDAEARIEVEEAALDEPFGLLANAINLLLDDLAFRQGEREVALEAAVAARAKQEFLAQLSHDMQTPLALLRASVDLLTDSAADESDLQSAVPVMRRATTRLQALVQQLLDFARLQSGRNLAVQMSVVPLEPLVHRVVKQFEDHANVELDLPDELPTIRADADHVRRILTDLLTVAFAQAATGSLVTLRASAEQATVRLMVEYPAGGLVPDDVNRALEAFEQGHSGLTGTGLSLFVSRALAEAQGGSLAVELAGDGRMRLRLSLPTAVGQH